MQGAARFVSDCRSCALSLALSNLRIACCRAEGHIFDKEAIYQYIITKKNEYSRKLKEYERQKKKEQVRIL
jgi:nitric oxide synthase-interacting protein